MEFSKPIITSNNSSMAEIAKGYSILVNPNDRKTYYLYEKDV